MSLFALDRKNSRHLQAVEKQLYSVRIHPTTTPSQKVIKSMSPEGGTYASKVRIHVFELLRDSNSNLPTQNEICTLVCKLATMTQSTYNDPDYYTSVEGLERRAIEDWEKVHGKTDHTTEAAAKIPAVAVNKWHKAAATRKLNATQRLAKQQRAEAKKNEKGVGKKRAGAVGRKPARSPEKKSLVGCDGQNGLGLDIPPAPCGNPSSEEGCSAQDAQGRSKKKAKVAAAATDRSQTEEETNRMVSATITGTMHALEQRAAQRPQYSLNGNRSVSGTSRRATPPIQISTATGTAVNNSNEMSRVTYDHLGNIVP